MKADKQIKIKLDSRRVGNSIVTYECNYCDKTHSKQMLPGWTASCKKPKLILKK